MASSSLKFDLSQLHGEENIKATKRKSQAGRGRAKHSIISLDKSNPLRSTFGTESNTDTTVLTTTAAEAAINNLDDQYEKLIQPSRVYNYHCDSNIVKGGFAGKHVKWTASYDKPIEMLLYPSLHEAELTKDNRNKLKAVIPFVNSSQRQNSNSSNSSNNSQSTHAVHVPKPIWRADISETLLHSTSNENSKSLLGEIALQGEESFKKGLRSRFQTKQKELEDEEIQKQKRIALHTAGLPISQLPRLRRGAASDESGLVKSSTLVADELYSEIAKHISSRKSRAPVLLSKSGPEELAHFEAKRSVEKIIPNDQVFTTEGVMYYRMKHTLHQNALNAQDDDDSTDSRKQVLRKWSTAAWSNNSNRKTSSFQRRMTDTGNLAASGSGDHSPTNLPSHDDNSSVRSLDFEILDADVTRIRRAMQANYSGYATKEIISTLAHNDTMSTQRRHAQDALLLSQLRVEILPEPFIKKSVDLDDIFLDLSHYSIGDEHAMCLSDGISKLLSLHSLGLKENRLTSIGAATIVGSLSVNSLKNLDLSYNVLHGNACTAIAEHFKRKNVLELLDMSKCKVDYSDIAVITQSMIKFQCCQVKHWILADNAINADAVRKLGEYLVQPFCSIQSLDLSWNEIGPDGAASLSSYLCESKSLLSLNIAANAIQDIGGQMIASSLMKNRTLKELDLSQNNIKGCTCFVFSKTLRGHSAMTRLDLSQNPLGEAGGRSLFRSILRGFNCIVVMRSCQFRQDDFLFKHSNPSEDSPYTLDMSEPYKASVLAELMAIAVEESGNCKFESISYRENPKARDTPIGVAIKGDAVVLKSTGAPWIPPTTGIITVEFQHDIIVPTLDKAISSRELSIVGAIVANGVTELDKQNWLKLLSADIYLTTAQADKLIEYFIQKKTIGLGGLTKFDVFKGLWYRLLDSGNMYDFLCRHLELEGRKSLVYALSFEKFKFNWINPTGHWRLTLSDQNQRGIMMRLAAINNSESEYSRTQSRRQDTSQWGNWFNFRNARYDGQDNEIVIDKDFVANIPYSGVLEFDYVSTTRPNVRKKTQRDKVAAAAAAATAAASPLRSKVLPHINTNVSDGMMMIRQDSDTSLDIEIDVDTFTDGEVIAVELDVDADVEPEAATRNNGGDNDQNVPTTGTGGSAVTTNLEDDGEHFPIVTDEEYFRMVDMMGLTARSRRFGSAVLFSLMELQHASAKYYFPVIKVIGLLDYFSQEDHVQAKIVICMFNRIWDLHNIDYLFRCISIKAQQMVLSCLGCLNVVNPLKPCLDFVLCLRYNDNRIQVHSLLEISATDGGDQINEDPRTDISVVTFYGSTQRLLNDARPETLRLAFCDVGERSLQVNWKMRVDHVRKYLVGNWNAYNKEMYKIISMYREMESAKALGRGPIEMQYAQYLMTAKSSRAKSR